MSRACMALWEYNYGRYPMGIDESRGSFVLSAARSVLQKIFHTFKYLLLGTGEGGLGHGPHLIASAGADT